MKRIIKVVSVLLIGMLLLTGCNKINKEAALEFKNSYESLNGKTNASGAVHRVVTIDEHNPFVTTTAKEVVKKIENKETFYLYVGDKLCPWCRSVIEKAVEVANKNNITEILYVPIWDDEGNEILRDKYVVNDEGTLEKTVEGTEEYYKLLESFEELLEPYTVNNDGVIINIGEGRIFAPTFIYIKNGEAKRLTTAISEKQTNSREELTKEILDEEEEKLTELFVGKTCNDNSGC